MAANETTEPARCGHKKLTAFSGGYYIGCMDCGMTWVCEAHHTAEGCGARCDVPGLVNCNFVWTRGDAK